MGIYIKGMEMPTDDMKNIMILADGRVFQFSGYGNPKPLGTAVPVPPHGRLGDLDELSKKIEHDRYNHTHTDGLAARHHVAEYGHFLKVISDVPTIIPAIK